MDMSKAVTKYHPPGSRYEGCDWFGDDDDDDYYYDDEYSTDGRYVTDFQMMAFLSLCDAARRHQESQRYQQQVRLQRLAVAKVKSEMCANELIDEEEKEKRKREKRKRQKKNRKERRRQERLNQQSTTNHKDDNADDSSDDDDDDDKENSQFDATNISDCDQLLNTDAAFFNRVIAKSKQGRRKKEISESDNSSINDKSTAAATTLPVELTPEILRGKELAVQGNRLASIEEFAEAIENFTEAIALDSTDYRYFGNRSYCYDKIGRYKEALEDAKKAVALAPTWPKGYFRQGRAQVGLKMYSLAEESFQRVLRLDCQCEEAELELTAVRIQQLTLMGFSECNAVAALARHNSVQKALDSLLQDDPDLSADDHTSVASSQNDGATFESLPSRSSVDVERKHARVFTASNRQPVNNTKLSGVCTVWVGNISTSVTQDMLRTLFSRCGTVVSIHCLPPKKPDKLCGFVEFDSHQSAQRALNTLQGSEFAGQRLIVRFPNNPTTSNQ